MGCRTSEKPKVNYKKGLWSPEEDERLRDYILRHGHGNWSSVPAKGGLQRNGKSCRLRWLNYLRPGLKHGTFSPQEVATVMKLHSVLGNKWSQIAMHLPGRTDNEVKNYWNSHLKKEVVKTDQGSNSHASRPKSEDCISPNQTQLSEESNNQISPSGCSDSVQSYTKDSFQSTQHGMKNVAQYHLTHQLSNTPKVLFADWISDGAGMSCQCWDFTSNEEVNGTELLQVNMPSNYDLLHEFSNTSNYGQFKSQFNHGDQHSAEGSFFDPLSLAETCCSFHLSHDIAF